jgi:hypothetical protein
MTLEKFVSRYSNLCLRGLEKTSFFLLKKLGLSADKNGALIAGLKKWHKEIIIVLLVVELNISERSV